MKPGPNTERFYLNRIINRSSDYLHHRGDCDSQPAESAGCPRRKERPCIPVKTLNTAETTYITTYPTCGYVGNDTTRRRWELDQGASGILDNVFPDREGYHYAINPQQHSREFAVWISGRNIHDYRPRRLAGNGHREVTIYSDPSAAIHFKVDRRCWTLTDPNRSSRSGFRTDQRCRVLANIENYE